MAAPTFMYPSGNNTFVPMAVAALQSNFSQNPSKFSINKYVTSAKVNNTSFYATIHDPDAETRQLFTDGRDMEWADGTEAPRNFTKKHAFKQYTTTRYARGFAIGDIAEQNASEMWSVVADHAASAAGSLMTNRTVQVLTALTTSGNWDGATSSATSLGGGQWSAATAANLYIQAGISAAIQNIELATNRSVSIDELALVISPATAYTISKTAEVRGIVANSPFSKEYLEQSDGWKYGLPPFLYGLRVIVEGAVKNVAHEGATRSASYILGKDALIVSRPDSLVGPLNTMSTVTLGLFSDLNVNLEHDNFNLMTKGIVYDNYAVIMRPTSGYYISAVVA